MCRRFVVLATLIALILGSGVIYSPAQAQAGNSPNAIVIAFGLVIRSDPSTAARRLGMVRIADMVTVLGRNTAGTWLQVRTAQSLVGWVSATWVKLVSGNLMSVPVVASGSVTLLSTTTTVTGVTGSVLAARLNVRSSASASASRVGFLVARSVVTVLGRNSAGTWLKVQTSQGLVGWVSARWLRVLGNTVMTLPVVL